MLALIVSTSIMVGHPFHFDGQWFRSIEQCRAAAQAYRSTHRYYGCIPRGAVPSPQWMREFD